MPNVDAAASEVQPPTENVLDAIRAQRIEKAKKLRELGLEPYPAGPFPKTPASEALALAEGDEVTIAGRVMLLRVMGNIAFLQVHDESGDIQVLVSKKEIEDPERPEVGFKFLVRQLDMGDFVTVTGTRMTTKAGEPSVSAKTLRIISKSLRPLPDKHAGLTNEDILLRKRYLDILLHRDVQEMIYKKSRFWREVRRFLEDRGFTEVATPVLEHTTGGADAKPFRTFHNFLDSEVSLRISTGELWQKRLLVGGMEKVFEIGRQFRNESQSREHANDYEQMEFYWAYANAQWGMEMVEAMFKHVIATTFGTLQFELHRNDRTYQVDLGKEWERYDYVETIERLSGVNVTTAPTEAIIAKLEELGAITEEQRGNRSRAVDGLWKYCRKLLAGPGFLVNEPVALSPLAKRSAEHPEIAERFHVVIAGSELGNGYSELNDPIDQAERFAEQQAMRDAGDEEAQEADWEFIEALEYAMPPAFGFGMSERVFSFFMDKSLRECQIFPLLKPLDRESQAAQDATS